MFDVVTIDTCTLLPFDCALINVVPWLRDVWITTGKKVSVAEVALRERIGKKGAYRTPEQTFPIAPIEKRLLLYCHFFRYWESKDADCTERAEDLIEWGPEFERMSGKQASAAMIESGCRNPSKALLDRKYNNLRTEAKRIVRELKLSPQPIEDSMLRWLLSVPCWRSFADSMYD